MCSANWFASRSPFSYLNNPAEERAKYQYNVDKNMTLLRCVSLHAGDDQLCSVLMPRSSASFAKGSRT